MCVSVFIRCENHKNTRKNRLEIHACVFEYTLFMCQQDNRSEGAHTKFPYQLFVVVVVFFS